MNEWVAITVQRFEQYNSLRPIGFNVWSEANSAKVQTLSATSAGAYVRQGSDCKHTAQVICDQRSVQIDGSDHFY